MNEKIRKVKRIAKQIQLNMIAKQLKTTENTQNPQKSQQIVAFILWKSPKDAQIENAETFFENLQN